MPANKPQPGLGDYVAIAICPILIMALVGSLLFFLLEILYAGQYTGRLQWILFLFVFAAVLIARISMDGGIAERAPLYGLALGGATLFAVQKLVDYPADSPMSHFSLLINVGLMGIVWWCAHRLTWDCTFIDEHVDASGAGVLEAAGLEADPGRNESSSQANKEASFEQPKGQPGLLAWWDRYRRYREEQQRKPHTPGVWVVYFSLAALPLYGLGQSLIPAGDTERRRYVFWLMGIYVASGLGLLLATCYLGLRRYLRQRKLEMPGAMTRTWLIFGGIMIVVLLVVGIFLPRPNAEYPLIHLGNKAGSEEKEASRYAVLGNNPGKGEGRGGAGKQPQGQEGSSGSGSQDGKGGSGQNQGSSGQQSPGDGSGSGKGDGRSGNNPGQGQQGGQDGQGKSGEGQDPGQSGNSNANQNQGQDGQGDKQQADHDPARKDQAQKGNQQSSEKSGDQKGKSNDPADAPPKEAAEQLKSLASGLLKLLKWIVFGLILLVVGFFVVRAVLKSLGNFTLWARRLFAALEAWWRRLFGGWVGMSSQETAASAQEETRPARPFASFHNPFASGMDSHTSAEEVVRYSFQALEAWGREHGTARRGDETPLEFVDRLAEDAPPLEAASRRLAGLYARAAYARGRLPVSCLTTVRQFWQRLEAVAEAPLSAE